MFLLIVIAKHNYKIKILNDGQSANGMLKPPREGEGKKSISVVQVGYDD